MSIQEILTHCDHTLLKQEATWEQIKEVCDDGLQYQCASVCIPPAYVRQAANYVGNRLKICTVIGFPNGYSTTAVKVFETEDAIRSGADEIDMVINLGWVKDQRWDDLLEEIKAVKASCEGRILKVIVEACLLTEEEKVTLCDLVTRAGAEYIKTSTGFSTGGATVEDVALFRAHIGPEVQIKAAGGIHTAEQAEAMMDVGATRIGASALMKIAKREAAHHNL
ncbi:MAG: deoxyribose-phosphate aldolase [Oscillospiraceae bacterium]|nr:deoxyribose-phosphate aldolase [Oscillospiraceae bacterium]